VGGAEVVHKLLCLVLGAYVVLLVHDVCKG
jgi:hypothetical protein